MQGLSPQPCQQPPAATNQQAVGGGQNRWTTKVVIQAWHAGTRLDRKFASWSCPDTLCTRCCWELRGDEVSMLREGRSEKSDHSEACRLSLAWPLGSRECHCHVHQRLQARGGQQGFCLGPDRNHRTTNLDASRLRRAVPANPEIQASCPETIHRNHKAIEHN